MLMSLSCLALPRLIQPARATYAGVEANGLRVHAQAAELDQLLELDG